MEPFQDRVKKLMKRQGSSTFKRCQTTSWRQQTNQDEELIVSRIMMNHHNIEQKKEQALMFFRSLSQNISQSQLDWNYIDLINQQKNNQNNIKYFSIANVNDLRELQLNQKDRSGLQSEAIQNEQEQNFIEYSNLQEDFFSQVYRQQLFEEDKILTHDEFFYEVDEQIQQTQLKYIQKNGLSLHSLRRTYRDWARNQLLFSLYYIKIKNNSNDVQSIGPEQRQILQKQFKQKLESMQKVFKPLKIKSLLKQYLDQGTKDILEYTQFQNNSIEKLKSQKSQEK